MIKISANQKYEVKLTRLVTMAGRKLRPANTFVFQGGYLKKLIDQEGENVIADAKRI